MNETKKFLEYSLAVTGIFGRNRKSKFESIRLVDSVVKLSPEALQPLMQAELAGIKAKPGCRYRVIETPVEESTSGGFTSRSFMLFSGVTIFEGVVA